MRLSISHRRLAIAAGVGVIALGLAAGAAVLTPSGAAEAKGGALKIALFTPPVPKIDPGETMEVGELTDGYVHRPAPRRETIEWVEFDDGWWEADEQDPPREVAYLPPSREPEVPPPPEEVRRSDSMGFGFEPRAEAERRVVRSAPVDRRPPPHAGEAPPRMRSAPPDRGPLPQGGRAPPRIIVSGERQAVFY